MPSAKQVLSIVLVFALTFSYLVIPTSQADGENATINGTVRNANTTLPIEDVNVTAYEEGGAGVYYNETDSAGLYSMDVIDGSYTLRASEYPVYYIFERNGIQVGYGQTVTENFDLIPHGGENSGFEGEVTDGVTDDPINGVMVYFRDSGNETAWLGFTIAT